MSTTRRRGPWRPGALGWLGGVFLLVAVYAGYRGFASLGVVTPTVVIVLAAVVAGAVLVLALIAHPGPFRSAALRAAVTLVAYFVTLAVWPPAGSTGYHTAGALVAAVLVVGLLLRHRTPVRDADAIVLLAVSTGLALSVAVALHALAVGDVVTGAGLVAAGCVGAVGYLAASAVALDPVPAIPAQRDGLSAGSDRSRGRAPAAR
ncbi:hypothetical protein [Pseudonocardia pini]|uniref:hypothetical protein n=1 Tax=Pseudonocardia pini TaxID=2758030 RepID=UPI0015F0AD40|nr:hypothetical protein [Pseudonocardia pini]